MTKWERLKEELLQVFTYVPVLSTKEVERWFLDQGSPDKRASHILQILQGEGLLEGKLREIGKAKVWRLTKKGRDIAGTDYRPVPLSGNRKLDHYLGIARVCVRLYLQGDLSFFRTELRIPFTFREEEAHYCPDACFIYQDVPYVLEYQSSRLTPNQWREKWKVHEAFVAAGFPFGSWYPYQEAPSILVITRQGEEKVKQTDLPLTVLKGIEEWDVLQLEQAWN